MEYRWLTMLWLFQMNSKGTQSYIHSYQFSPKQPSPPGCHITLNRVPCALDNRSLLVIRIKYSSAHMSIPNSLSLPPALPPGNHKLVLYIWVCFGLVHLFHFFLDSMFKGYHDISEWRLLLMKNLIMGAYLTMSGDIGLGIISQLDSWFKVY